MTLTVRLILWTHKVARALRVAWIAGKAVLMAERDMSAPDFVESTWRRLSGNLRTWSAAKDAAIEAGNEAAFFKAEVEGLHSEMYAVAELAGQTSGGFHYPLSFAQISDRHHILHTAAWPLPAPEYTVRFLGMTAADWCAAPAELVGVYRMAPAVEEWRAQLREAGLSPPCGPFTN